MNRPRNILLLEDEPGIRGAMTTALNLHGHRALPAANAQEALAIARTEEIDLLITDLRLQGADGIETLEQILKIRPRVRAIIMTGYATLESAVQAMRLGAVDYLTKPFRVESILRAIESAAAQDTNESASFHATLPWKKQIAAEKELVAGLLLEASAVLENAGASEDARKRVLATMAESLDNATAHAFPSENGWITAELWVEGNSFAGRISDSGCGFEAAVAIAQALSQETSRISGLRFLHDGADDLRIRSSRGKGCVVEFRIEEARSEQNGRITLPSIPSGDRWNETMRRVRETATSLRIEGSPLKFLTPRAAADLHESIAAARDRGLRIELENFRLPHPGSALLWRVSANRDEHRARKALWA